MVFTPFLPITDLNGLNRSYLYSVGKFKFKVYLSFHSIIIFIRVHYQLSVNTIV